MQFARRECLLFGQNKLRICLQTHDFACAFYPALADLEHYIGHSEGFIDLLLTW